MLIEPFRKIYEKHPWTKIARWRNLVFPLPPLFHGFLMINSLSDLAFSLLFRLYLSFVLAEVWTLLNKCGPIGGKEGLKLLLIM